MDIKKTLKKIWKFLWEDESPQSYIAFIIVSYLLLKFIAYPGFLLIMGWQDVVSVLSGSMIHAENVNTTYFDWLDSRSINYSEFPFINGLNPGDAVTVVRVLPEDINVGDVIIYVPYKYTNSSIIHRVIAREKQGEIYFYTTKGDANIGIGIFEINITYDQILGKAGIAIPILGYPRAILHNFLGI